MALDSRGGLGVQAQHFDQGQAQVAQGVQEPIQGGLIDDLTDQHRLARLLPAQAEAGEPVRSLRPQLPLHAKGEAALIIALPVDLPLGIADPLGLFE